MMRDLRGARAVIVVGVAALVVANLVDAMLLSYGVTTTNTMRLADGPGIAVAIAGGLALLVGLILWLRAATQNQERLGVPVQGSIWLRAILGFILPLAGVLLLFPLAARLLEVSGRAAGRPSPLGVWFGLWITAYIAWEVARVAMMFEWMDAAVVAFTMGTTMLLALPGLHRFLCTVEAAQEEASGGVRAPPRLPPATFPSD